MEHFHTYETEHEYIEYFETLLSELKVCILKASKTSFPAMIRCLLGD
jgi:type III secretory pathway component EscT